MKHLTPAAAALLENMRLRCGMCDITWPARSILARWRFTCPNCDREGQRVPTRP